MLTQTRTRDRLVLEAELIYLTEHQRLIRQAEELYMQWAEQNARHQFTDAGELELLRKMRGIFDDPANMRRVFGRLAGLVQSDAETAIRATVPAIDTSKFAELASVQRWANANAELIKDIGDLIIGRVAKAVVVGAGKHITTLAREFKEASNATESRVQLWARDQTLTLHSQITRERHEQAGIRRYFWTDSNDERVRHIHGELGERSDLGEAFVYSDPPIMAPDGRRGNPGEDYQCRCTAFPILE